TGSQTTTTTTPSTTTGSQTTTPDGTQSTTTTTTTTPSTTPQTTTPAPGTTTSSDTTSSTSTLPQRNDEGSPYRHGEIGVFANYLRLASANDLNTIGVGANLDFNVNRHVQFEAQMAYNFERNVTSASTTGGFTSFNRTGLRS